MPNELFARSVAELKGIQIEKEESFTEQNSGIERENSVEQKKPETPVTVKPSVIPDFAEKKPAEKPV